MKRIIYAFFQVYNIYQSDRIAESQKLYFIGIVLQWIRVDLLKKVNYFSEDEMKKFVDKLDHYKSQVEKEREGAAS